jgi:hypothetical protein
VFSIASPLGAIEYHAGRGLRFGDTGLTIGGFTTFELNRAEGEPAEIALDSLNFLIDYEPIPPLDLFAELEVGDLAELDTGDGDVTSDPDLTVERLHADWSVSDAVNFRVGKFQTPVGRWNLVPAEPFVWTAEEPVTVEQGFDEHQTGVALFGSTFRGSRTLGYWLYGQVVDELDTPSDESPADRSAGARLEYGSSRGEWSVGTSFLSSKKDGHWSQLGGLDAVLRRGPVELTTEVLVQGGDIPGRDLWGAHVLAVYDLQSLTPRLNGLYLVGRYEHFHPSQARRANVFDVGLTWIPVHWLNLKLGYRFADRETREVERRLRASISVLF